MYTNCFNFAAMSMKVSQVSMQMAALNDSPANSQLPILPKRPKYFLDHCVIATYLVSRLIVKKMYIKSYKIY